MAGFLSSKKMVGSSAHAGAPLGVVILCSCIFAIPSAERSVPPPVHLGADKPPQVNSSAFKTVFSDVAEKVVPTVVSVIPTIIDTLSVYKNPFYEFFGEKFPDAPFDFFFGPRQSQPNADQPPQPQEFHRQGLGSGVIVSLDGHILTNYHVIAGAHSIEVKLSDGRVFAASVIGSDSLSDIAVIKIAEKVDNLPVAYMGNSEKLRPGDWVIAIGNPFSLASSVTAGIVSAVKRQVATDNSFSDYIQTDAAINPGNSGGALVNLDGEVIGINTLIYTQSGGFMGIGFAIPINAAQRAMGDLVSRGKVVRGWIGVSVQDLNRATRQALDLGNGTGVLVADIYEGQPAHRAGLKRGDIIISIGGATIGSVRDLREIVTGLSPGGKVPVLVLRDGTQQQVTLTVDERSEPVVAKFTSGKKSPPSQPLPAASERIAGLGVANLNPGLRRQYGIAADAKGIVVLHADVTAGDGRSELRPGDLLTEVKIRGQDFQAIPNTITFRRKLEAARPGDPALVQVQRGGNTFYIAFSVGKP